MTYWTASAIFAIFAILASVGTAVLLNRKLAAEKRCKESKVQELLDAATLAAEEELKRKQQKLQTGNKVLALLKELQALSNEQKNLYAAMRMPSSNSLHSKYKNQIAHQIVEIHYDKMSVIKSILGLGEDPLIYYVDESSGDRTKIKLSDYLVRLELATEGFPQSMRSAYEGKGTESLTPQQKLLEPPKESNEAGEPVASNETEPESELRPVKGAKVIKKGNVFYVKLPGAPKSTH